MPFTDARAMTKRGTKIMMLKSAFKDSNHVLLPLATSSSVYYNQYGDFSAYWGPAFAIDGAQSSTWYNLFHSAHEPYPWLKITLPGATGTDTTVNSVTLRSRCDANAWSCSVPNNINVEVS